MFSDVGYIEKKVKFLIYFNLYKFHHVRVHFSLHRTLTIHVYKDNNI